MEYALLALILAVLGYAVYAYNSLVKARQMAREAWSGIDVQLKRRFNLIPNLVEVVKAYATHEQQTFTEVTRLRAKVNDLADDAVEERARAEGQLGQALMKLLALAENYPDLKANQNFHDLQQQLSMLENEIQMARRYYNGAARALNVLVESFPSNIVASLFKFHQAEYFEIENEAERAVPQVAF